MRFTSAKWFLCVAGLAIVGCGKSVDLTFVNMTSQQRDVVLTSPGGTTDVGTLAGKGSRLHVKLKLDNGDLPADVAWAAGDQNGHFTVSKKTADKLMIPVGSNVGPIDKNTEVKETKVKEIKDRPVEQHEVVE
jgi:hypothetical protein